MDTERYSRRRPQRASTLEVIRESEDTIVYNSSPPKRHSRRFSSFIPGHKNERYSRLASFDPLLDDDDAAMLLDKMPPSGAAAGRNGSGRRSGSSSPDSAAAAQKKRLSLRPLIDMAKASQDEQLLQKLVGVHEKSVPVSTKPKPKKKGAADKPPPMRQRWTMEFREDVAAEYARVYAQQQRQSNRQSWSLPTGFMPFGNNLPDTHLQMRQPTW
jgi:hypothetical protein